MQGEEFTTQDDWCGGLGAELPAAEGKESGGRAPSVWQLLQFFNENNTLLGLNFCLKIFS